MKLATNAFPVERFGVVETEVDFRIKPTPKAFQILTSKLYKDKIAAVIRELSCNAYDSHVEAGKPTEPFHVHLPNALEPELVIRDFGTGLSDRAVRTIFTTFFESTKEDTNDQIGALGLGCKSPFSYTDTYTVKSFWKGRLNTYVCFIENALPKIRRVSNVATSESNGVEIRITAKTEDFERFQQKAATIFKWFDVKPEVTGGRYFTHAANDNKLREGANWYFANTDHASKAIMGNVAYPIDHGVMSNHLTDFERKLLKNFVFFYRIGELDIQAGREELSYDSQTIQAIKKRIKRVSSELCSLVEHEFDSCATFIEATRKYLERGGMPLFELVPPRWRGQMITGGVVPPLEGKLLVRRHPSLKFEYPHSVRSHGRAFASRTVEQTDIIEPWEKVTIFINDLKKGAAGRFSKFSRDATYPCYMFEPADGVTVEQTLAAFAELPNVRLLSSIKTERTKAKVYYFSSPRIAEVSNYFGNDYRNEIDVDLDFGGYYVLSRNKEVQGPSGESNVGSDELMHWIRVFQMVLGNRDRIHIVPWTLRKEFVTDDGWKTIYEAVLEALDQRLSDPTFVADAHIIADRARFAKQLFDRHNLIANCLPKTHPLNKFLARYNMPTTSDAAKWHTIMLRLHSAAVDGSKDSWPAGVKPKKLYESKRLRLQSLWDGLNDMPLLKAVVSNSPLDAHAIRDLAEYSMLALDKRQSSS